MGKTVARNFRYSLEFLTALWNTKLAPLLGQKENTNKIFLSGSIASPLLVHETWQTGARAFFPSFFYYMGLSAQNETTVWHANERGFKAKEPEHSSLASIF